MIIHTVLMAGAALAVLAGASAPTMAASNGVKSIVLVHGAWADGSNYAKIIPILEKAGYNVVAVQNPLSSMAASVDATKRVIDAQPGKVILVGHSLGGAVITEAGANDKVAGLVYIAAFAPPEGSSVNDLLKDQGNLPWTQTLQIDAGGYASLSKEGVAKYFAQDLPPAEIDLIAATQGPVFGGMLDEMMSVAAYTTRPTWYIVAKHDNMIPPVLEASLAKVMGATTTVLDSSHVAMISKPQEVADIILEAAKSAK